MHLPPFILFPELNVYWVHVYCNVPSTCFYMANCYNIHVICILGSEKDSARAGGVCIREQEELL